MKTKMTDAQKIERIVKRHKEDGWTFYAHYSGRCMFGRCSPGIVCPPYDTPKVVNAVKRAGIKAYPSHDSMGRDNIVYWTDVESDPEPITICLQCGQPARDRAEGLNGHVDGICPACVVQRLLALAS